MIYRYTNDSAPMGHLTLKSSPFCPNGGKLTSQYLVVDHMVAHYKKLKNVRSYVDTSPPKTWISSQKVRDRIMREALKTGVLKPEWLLQSPLRPKVHHRPSVPSSEFDRSDMLLQMQSLALADDANDEFDGTMTSSMQKRHPQNGRTRSARQYSETLGERERSRGSARDYSRTSERTKVAKFLDDSDLMETHRMMFTEGKAFTPRTLRTNMSSRLAKNNCYNPPRRRAKSAKSATPDGAFDHGTMKSAGGETARFNDTLLTLRSYDSRDHSTPSDVPPLNISQDLDNQLWLKEQSKRIQEKQVQIIPPEPSVIPSKARKPATPTSDRASPVHEKRPIPAASDEDLLYLNFMTDVTADILNRGTFTNRALKQVFESHIAKHQGHLKLSKMQDMIKELGTKLGIPETDNEEGFGFASTKRLTPAADLSAEGQSTNNSLLMTRQTFDPKQLLRSGHRGSRASGLTTNTQPILYDVQEVQEDDLSGESGRTGKTKIKKRQQEVISGRSYDELSVAGDSFRSVESASLGFDELDYRILGTTQVLPPEKVSGSRPGEGQGQGQGQGQGHLLGENTNGGTGNSGRSSPEKKKRRSPGRRAEEEQHPSVSFQGRDSTEVDPFSSPRHGQGRWSPDAMGFQKESVENSGREDFEPKVDHSGVKTRSAKSSPQPKSPPKTPKIEDDVKKTSSTNDAGAGESSRANDDVTGNFDDESSLLDTLGEYKHSLEVTDNYDDYDDDYESPPQSLPRPNNNNDRNDDDEGF